MHQILLFFASSYVHRRCIWKSSLYKHCFYYRIHLEIVSSSFSFVVASFNCNSKSTWCLQQAKRSHKGIPRWKRKDGKGVERKIKSAYRTNQRLLEMRSIECAYYIHIFVSFGFCFSLLCMYKHRMFPLLALQILFMLMCTHLGHHLPLNTNKRQFHRFHVKSINIYYVCQWFYGRVFKNRSITMKSQSLSYIHRDTRKTGLKCFILPQSYVRNGFCSALFFFCHWFLRIICWIGEDQDKQRMIFE